MISNKTDSIKSKSAGWEDLRKRARSLETDVDAKLLHLNKFGTTIGSGANVRQLDNSMYSSGGLSSQSTFETLSMDIQNLLDQLTNVNERMEEVTRDSSYVRNAASMHTLQRHREILQDYANEFKRTQHNIKSLLERERLMTTTPGVCQISMPSDGLNNRRSDLLLKEHEHISSSHRLLDDQINLAIHTKEGLFDQQKALKTITKKVNALIKKYPAIHSLMQKIQIRKRRHAVIIALVITACLILFFLYGIS